MNRLFAALKPLSLRVFALFFVLAGLNHFRSTDFYVRIMPPYLPAPLTLVYLSGLAEIALGVGLLISHLQRQAAWGLVALLIAVFPANVHMAVHSELFPEFNSTLLWWRLPVQGLLVMWAYWYTRKCSFHDVEEDNSLRR